MRIGSFAELVGAQTRVRVGGVEGRMVGYHHGINGLTARILDDRDVEHTVSGDLEQLESLDEDKLEAFNDEQDRLTAEKLAARAKAAEQSRPIVK